MVALEPRVIEVPIDNSNDVLEIDCSQLPEHATEICDILENEGSALRFYHLFALEYYKQGNTEEATVALKRGIANAKANDQTAKVPLLALLASIYVQKAKTTASSATSGGRDMILQMAATLLSEAERINRSEPNIFLVKGMLAMAQRLPDSALAQFNTALQYDATNLSCLLGKARVLYGKRHFQQALAIYQQILTIKPTGKPDARIGIGMCLCKLGYAEDARRALARAIEVDSMAAAPHILLATMDLNEVKRSVDPRISNGATADQLEKTFAKTEDLLHRVMDSLHKAYKLQPENPAALIFLADRLFFQSDYDGARKLGEHALKAADTMAIQAEAHYQIARAYHAAKRFDMAYDAYQKCLAINERHSLARYGLGQMQLQRTDMSSAEATFQRVLDRHPRCVEVLRALGYLHARLPNTKAKALEYYEREMQVVAEEAAERVGSSDDASTWFDDANLFLEAGLLYEASSAKRARKSYLMAANILVRTAGGPSGVLPELWNNLGALGQLTADSSDLVLAEYSAAASGCTEALAAAHARISEKKAASGGAAPSKLASEVQRLENTLVTISYNVARFYEHSGLWAKAEALYHKLLNDVPTYADARLRLAYIAFYCRGDGEAALAHVAQAVKLDPKRTSAWLIRGNIELQRNNVQDARRAFEHVLKEIAKHDVYALCSLGNYYLAAGKSESARASTTSSTVSSSVAKKAKDLAAQNYKRALEFFDKCLVLDPKCALAAHGAAIAMAENDFATEARRVFQSVRDAATTGLGPASLCNPAATELVFKTAGCKHALVSSDARTPHTASVGELPLVGCDVMLWSAVNAAHAYVEVGNYRQAVLAYEACSRRLEDTTAGLEAADLQSKGGSHATGAMIVSALEPVVEPASAADSTDDKAATLQMMTKSERTDRAKAKRDIQLYHARALYIQAKADKDIEVMRLSLELIRQTCDKFDVKLPESALSKSDSNGTDAKDETTAVTATDADGDVSMKSAEDDDKQHRHVQVRLQPEDCLLLFDLALVEQAVAQLASEMPESQRTLQILDAATSDLEHSTTTFTFLASWGKAALKKRQKLLYNPKLSSERAAFSKSLIAKLQRKRQEQEQLERQRQENVELWRKQREEEVTRKKEEAEKAENERREVEDRLLRETEERNAILREQMAADAAKQIAEASALASAPASKSSKRKTRAKETEDAFISDHEDLDGYYSSGGDTGADSNDENDGAADTISVQASDANGSRRRPPQRPSTRRISHTGTKKRKQVLSRLRKDKQSISAVQSDDDQADSADTAGAAGANEEEVYDSSTPNKRRNVEELGARDGIPSKGDNNDDNEIGATPPPQGKAEAFIGGRYKTKAIVADSDSDSE
ncbi:protein required for normal CLN1 and CLN2 G1 cyclin expression [Coemansia sp. RSA 1813]|nr:protein required for normal CLN1 and CLN2 G1 cyclin expression [Coemansia sp. RSA 1646]KAJ1771401.1 protein required for normal CLN1 and CLN2 G1 cyclin expression [Coemansia sp. RSA 1843]KAJ2089162.1 protein required for normal CLN1 and CLN2 G1 cyclin expression [Coemansia sp. RSA 986]KAJ2213779.1 protein required for normal CLN1 and CLN2 G1 cyclin expression [Coemansia sp. RSA 487]KAJ2569272.1 protein required for normal CLN1 and CLN2 G1 cyclin expression [Coemansia sp. RSA 1813]